MFKSTNQSQKPITIKINTNNNLEIGGCDLLDLVSEYKTPLYVLDEATIRSVCSDYKQAFSTYPKTNIMYAMKALCTSALLKILSNEGLGFDAVSVGELYTLHKSNINMSEVIFNGNNKTFEQLSIALDLGVGRISVDNFLELENLNQLAKDRNLKVDIFLRVTPGIECHTHQYIQTGHLDSKFGFDLTQIDEVINLLKTNYKNLILRGLHAHIGSQIFETSIYSDEIEILCKEISRINSKYDVLIDEINIGGGIGVKYTQSDNPPSIFEIGELVTKKLKECIDKYKIPAPQLYLEPGRSIISTAGVTLYSVGSSKQVPNGRKYVALDGGMADNPRPSLYQAKYYAQKANNIANSSDKEIVTLCGRFCESGDILIDNIELPKLIPNDIICIYNTGAYNYSMSSNYNRVEKPAMVLVNNGECDVIVKRETLDDLLRNDRIPDRLKHD